MYNEYQPSLLLAPYIDKYWEFKGNPDYGMKINILPDGCTDFIFTLGEVADIAEQESLIMQPYRSYFVGGGGGRGRRGEHCDFNVTPE